MPTRSEQLRLAVRRGDRQQVQALLDAGADPSIATPAGLPIELAASGRSAPIVRLLWQAGATPTAAVLERLATWHEGGGDWRTLFVEVLDIAPRPWRDLALGAASFGATEALLLLLDRGADPGVIRDGCQPLHNWLRHCPRAGFEAAALQEQVDRSNASGGSAAALLHLASALFSDLNRTGDDPLDPTWLEGFDRLLAAGAPVDARDAEGWTPLWIALDEQLPAEVVDRLLHLGADPAGAQVEGTTLAQLVRGHPDPGVGASLEDR